VGRSGSDVELAHLRLELPLVCLRLDQLLLDGLHRVRVGARVRARARARG
jgi:hypothetical protein